MLEYVKAGNYNEALIPVVFWFFWCLQVVATKPKFKLIKNDEPYNM
jgi:hypothetical protein